MKQKFLSLISLVLALLAFLPSCSSSLAITEEKKGTCTETSLHTAEEAESEELDLLRREVGRGWSQPVVQESNNREDYWRDNNWNN